MDKTCTFIGAQAALLVALVISRTFVCNFLRSRDCQHQFYIFELTQLDIHSLLQFHLTPNDCSG